MPGSASSRRRNAGLEMTSALDGSVSVTAAVVGRSVTSEISPKKSPAPSVLTLRPFRRTSASPSSRTKNWRPGSPSRISSFPAGRSISSAIFAISFIPRFDTPANSGTRLRMSILLEALRRRIRAILRRERGPRLLRMPVEVKPLEARERRLDERTVAANAAERAERERLDVRVPELEQRLRVLLDSRAIAEPYQRLQPFGLCHEFEPVRVLAGKQAGQRRNEPLDRVEIVFEQRQPQTRRRERDLVPLHPERLRFGLEPLGLREVAEDAAGRGAEEQGALVANARRGQVAHDSPLPAQLFQLRLDGDAVQAMVRRKRLGRRLMELRHGSRRLEAPEHHVDGNGRLVHLDDPLRVRELVDEVQRPLHPVERLVEPTAVVRDERTRVERGRAQVRRPELLGRRARLAG